MGSGRGGPTTPLNALGPVSTEMWVMLLIEHALIVLKILLMGSVPVISSRVKCLIRGQQTYKEKIIMTDRKGEGRAMVTSDDISLSDMPQLDKAQVADINNLRFDDLHPEAEEWRPIQLQQLLRKRPGMVAALDTSTGSI